MNFYGVSLRELCFPAYPEDLVRAASDCPIPSSQWYPAHMLSRSPPDSDAQRSWYLSGHK